MATLPKWQQKVVAEHQQAAQRQGKPWSCLCPSCHWTRNQPKKG